MPYVIIIRELRKDPTLALKLALGEPTFLPPHLNRLSRLGGVRMSDVVRYARREVFGRSGIVGTV